jgi:hypothetical protein
MSLDWRRKLVRKFRQWAEERFPLQFPVRIYLRSPQRMGADLGYFVMDDDLERGTIAIRDDLNQYLLLDTLCEEWSHGRVVWLNDEEDNSDDPYHHATFWSEYGRIQHASRSVEW